MAHFEATEVSSEKENKLKIRKHHSSQTPLFFFVSFLQIFLDSSCTRLESYVAENFPQESRRRLAVSNYGSCFIPSYQPRTFPRHHMPLAAYNPLARPKAHSRCAARSFPTYVSWMRKVKDTCGFNVKQNSG
jgi:hypothetical protein